MSFVHGTWNGYINHKCRCDKCVPAGAIYFRNYRKEKRGKTPTKHNYTTGYVTYGCRCEVCVTAKEVYQQNRKGPKS